jgi:hypothetical protein
LRNVGLRRIIARISESQRTAKATLEVEVRNTVPKGALIAGRGLRRTFSGWIELASAIEDWRRSEAGDPVSPGHPKERRTP